MNGEYAIVMYCDEPLWWRVLHRTPKTTIGLIADKTWNEVQDKLVNLEIKFPDISFDICAVRGKTLYPLCRSK